MKKVSCKCADRVLVPDVNVADHFLTRLRGLMFKKKMPETAGLLLRPCNQIHTFSMKFAIDVVYISKNGTIVKIDPAVPPRKVCKTVREAADVLELCPGVAAAAGMEQGQTLTFE